LEKSSPRLNSFIESELQRFPQKALLARLVDGCPTEAPHSFQRDERVPLQREVDTYPPPHPFRPVLHSPAQPKVLA
jgi:hypothetical protein